MRHLPFALVAASALATLPAQELLRYRFEAGCGSQVINFAANSPAPNEGTIVTNFAGAPATSWTPGQFGLGLKGASTVAPATHNYVNTGWVPGTITGSMTWATWLKMDPAAPTPSLTYVFGNGTTFRVFTGGGGFFLTSSWGGSNVNTTANIQTLARAGWTHLACVLDGSTLQAQYFVNGVPENPITMSAAVNWTGANFFVGKHSGLTNASIFDLDDFVLVNRAMSAAEIGVLATSPYAADGRFGSTCGPLLQGNGQLPAVGNAAYGFSVNGPQTGFCWVLFGYSRCTIAGGSLPLPVDLGLFEPSLAGCLGHVDNDVGALGTVLVSGTANFGFPLPAWQGLAGLNLYGQGFTLDGATAQLRASNALAIGVGL